MSTSYYHLDLMKYIWRSPINRTSRTNEVEFSNNWTACGIVHVMKELGHLLQSGQLFDQVLRPKMAVTHQYILHTISMGTLLWKVSQILWQTWSLGVCQNFTSTVPVLSKAFTVYSFSWIYLLFNINQHKYEKSFLQLWSKQPWILKL